MTEEGPRQRRQIIIDDILFRSRQTAVTAAQDQPGCLQSAAARKRLERIAHVLGRDVEEFFRNDPVTLGQLPRASLDFERASEQMTRARRRMADQEARVLRLQGPQARTAVALLTTFKETLRRMTESMAARGYQEHR